jgi:hypothetical protein
VTHRPERRARADRRAGAKPPAVPTSYICVPYSALSTTASITVK